MSNQQPPEPVDASTDSDLESPPSPAWRRPLLLLSGISLLALGVYANADHLGLRASEGEGGYARFQHLGDPEPATSPEVTVAVHRGEEGRMGRPSAKAKSGLYAMKGPSNAVPQMARSFDPDMAARNAGILAVMEQQSGHFLASPHGGAMAVGNDDADVWGGLTGTEVGETYGVGGLGLIGVGKGGGGVGKGDGATPFRAQPRSIVDERYAAVTPNVFVTTAKDPKSTFSIDVDTASYANTRRFLLESEMLPPPQAVRTEELINYFDYDYALPSGEHAPFSVTTEVGPTPWNASKRLVHIGIQGMVPELDEIPPRNLVFLLDVSGSMSADDKLPLIKHGLARLTEQLDDNDRVSIVVYAGAAGAVLEPTSGANHVAILAALDRLESGGGTNGGEGIELAYHLAERAFIEGGVNRVILASDGDFNVGISDKDALVRLIERKRESGVFLSVLGVGTGNFQDETMEQLADKGNGNYAYIDGTAEAQKVLVEESGAMLQTIAKDVKIQVEFDPDQVAMHRLVGYENRVLAHRDFDDDAVDAGEIGAGHTVTALYEIVPTKDFDGDDLMTLNLRYKEPDGARSRKLSVAVDDDGLDLAQTSTDFRFSAAVAVFAESLRRTQGVMSYAEILALAEAALGEDERCYRHQFLDLVYRAGVLSGEAIEAPESACTPAEPSARRSVAAPEHEPTAEMDWKTFVLEVLQLLPPLLALPMFVLAYRDPRRRRRGGR